MADENQNQEDSSVIKELRQQLKERDERLSKLEPIARQSAFKEAGIDVESGPGKFFAEKYDGDLSADAIREAAEPYGFVRQQEEAPPATEGEQTQRRMDGLRQQSQPEGAGKRISFQEWTELSKSDPVAAKTAHADGRVDFPPHIAQNLAAPQGAA